MATGEAHREPAAPPPTAKRDEIGLVGKLLQVALGVIASVTVGAGWVAIALRGGFLAPASDPWVRAGMLAAALGYAVLAIAIWGNWERRPWFARTAAVVGGVFFTIQVVDLVW